MVEPILFGAEPAWRKDKALEILCMVLQTKFDKSLPTVSYEIGTVEKLAAALRKVYLSGSAHQILSVKDDYEANKGKLLTGYFKVDKNEHQIHLG